MNDQQIREIKIKGFKSIKNCDITLNNINILIGSNGAGKSNFISVFKLLQNVIEKSVQVYVEKAGGANALLFNGRKITDYLYFEFVFGLNSYDFKLIPNVDDSLIFESEHFNSEESWNSLSYTNGESLESKWDKGASNQVNKYIQPVLQDEKWRVYHFYDTSENARIKQTHKVSNNVELQYDAWNLAAFLYRLKNEYPVNYKQIVNSIKLIDPYFHDFYLENNGTNDDIKLRWMKVGSDDVFNANQFSDGTLRFICLATLFLQPENLQPETIIVDEPELGLHPYAITLLSELIKKSGINKQIIISTQSVELLNEFAVDQIIVVDRFNGETKFKRFTENELSDWLKDAYSMGDLWKKNILRGWP